MIELYHETVPAVLAELAETPELLRLGQVGMNCGCEYTAFPKFAGSRGYSRLEHSLGVGLIVWHFTEDAAQAAAGLLHDLATPTFAHVVDFLRGDYLAQEATEDGTRERIEGSSRIQRILARHGLRTDDVADYHRYPIADNDSPRLSADRLEYSLGNALLWGFLTRAEIAAIYADLRVGVNEDGVPELVFGSPGLAARFAEAALACSKVYVSDADRYAMQALSELLARGLETGGPLPCRSERHGAGADCQAGSLPAEGGLEALSDHGQDAARRHASRPSSLAADPGEKAPDRPPDGGSWPGIRL